MKQGGSQKGVIGLALVAFLLILGLARCGGQKATVSHLADLTQRRIAAEREWRDAREMPGGAPQCIELAAVPAGGFLRLGVLDPGAGEGVSARVEVAGQEIQAFKISGKGRWEDFRCTLSASVAPCRVVFDSAAPFAVAPCEVVANDAANPNVLIFLIDTLRQDHLGCYGYARATSPNIDAFAKDAVTFTELVPQSSWTKPSVASLLTSCYPGVHGAQDRPDMLRAGLPTLGAALVKAGYETQCFMSNRNCIPEWGFGNEFSRFVDVDSEHWVKADDGLLVDSVLRTLDFVAGRPWLFFVHAMGPHEPYTPPAPYDTQFVTSQDGLSPEQAQHKKDIDLYDGEIAYTDVQFGRLIAKLKALGLYDGALIVVLSDHGQEFWEHGATGHGTTLFEEQMRVPFLVKLPNGAHKGESHRDLIEMIDVAPTVLDLLGAPAEPRFQGESFRAILDGQGAGKRFGFASLSLSAAQMRSLRSAALKYIRDDSAASDAWYDLLKDPSELTPMTTAPPEGEGMARYAQQLASLGQYGLHILIMNDGKQNRAVRGTIAGAAMGAYELQYLPDKISAAQKDGKTEFLVTMQQAAGDGHVPARWQRALDVDPTHRLFASALSYEPDNALVRVGVPGDAEFEIALWVDDLPVKAIQTPAGSLALDPTSATAKISAHAIAGGPNVFDPASLPAEFAVYVWYVAQAQTISDEALAPELKRALEGLGYF